MRTDQPTLWSLFAAISSQNAHAAGPRRDTGCFGRLPTCWRTRISAAQEAYKREQPAPTARASKKGKTSKSQAMKRRLNSDLPRLRLFAPGELVRDSGVYAVIHSDHRPRHESTLLAGTKFPSCKVCGAEVRFSLVMPVRKPHIPAQKSPSILLADSESPAIRTLAAALEAEGYETKVVASGSKAIEQLQLAAYDAIVADLDLVEEASVFDLVNLAKRLQPNTVLLVSVGDPTPDKLRKLLTRVDYCVVKPLDSGELSSALTTLIARRQAAAAASFSY
jgi:CheY-like chemotaxis protein